MVRKLGPAAERKAKFIEQANRFASRLDDPAISASQIDDWIENGLLRKASELQPHDCWVIENLRRAVAVNHLRKVGFKSLDAVRLALWLRNESFHNRDIAKTLVREYRRLRRLIIKLSWKDKPQGNHFDPISWHGKQRLKRLGEAHPIFVELGVSPNAELLNVIYELGRFGEDISDTPTNHMLFSSYPFLERIPPEILIAFRHLIRNVFQDSLSTDDDPERGLSQQSDRPRNDYEADIFALSERPGGLDKVKIALQDIPKLIASIRSKMGEECPIAICELCDVLEVGLMRWPWPIFGAVLLAKGASKGEDISLPPPDLLDFFWPKLLEFFAHQDDAFSLRPTTRPR